MITGFGKNAFISGIKNEFYTTIPLDIKSQDRVLLIINGIAISGSETLQKYGFILYKFSRHLLV